MLLGIFKSINIANILHNLQCIFLFCFKNSTIQDTNKFSDGYYYFDNNNFRWGHKSKNDIVYRVLYTLTEAYKQKKKLKKEFVQGQLFCKYFLFHFKQSEINKYSNFNSRIFLNWFQLFKQSFKWILQTINFVTIIYY